MRATYLVLVSALIACGWARAESDTPLPVFDVDGGCHSIKSDVLVRDCVEREQYDYDELRTFGVKPDGSMLSWKLTPEPVRRFCRDSIEAQVASNQSVRQHPYNYLKACLIKEGDVFASQHPQDSNPMPKFQP